MIQTKKWDRRWNLGLDPIDIMVVHLFLLDLYKTFRPSFLLENVNNIYQTIFILKNRTSVKSKCNLKVDKTSEAMIIKNWLINQNKKWFTKLSLNIFDKELFFLALLILYHFQPQTWNQILKMGASDIFRIEELNTRANVFVKFFLVCIHQKWQWSRRNERKNCAMLIEEKTS